MAEQINPAGASTPGATYVRIPLSLTASGPAEGQPDADLSSLTFLHEAVCAALRFWAPFLRFAGGDKEGVTQRLPARLEGQASRTEVARSVDRLLHANMGRFTLGLSPYALWLAYADWAIHLSASPGKWQQLAEKSLQEQVRFLVYMLSLAADPASPPCIEPMPEDQRFQNEAWRRLPFNLISQAFLLTEQWWRNATTGISGVSLHHQQVVAFMARQLLDALAPTNFIALNPEVIEATLHEGGQNLVRGFANFWEDFERAINDEPPPGAEKFRPGQTVAITRGKVVHRNRLIELIQYAPATKEVQKEPVLIIPAWIMKYYILDLSPENSLVKYLVDHGHTVFMVSWHNPGAEDRDLGMDDYLRFGVLDALEAVRAIVPDIKVNAVGYCLGGTLLSIAAAYLAQRNETFLNSISMFAAQTDFTEAGELTLFVDESQISYLEDIMWEQGYLDSRHMAGTFQLLRSSDLIWSRITREYLMGSRSQMIDLFAWNADATRMPYRMHSEYLRSLYLRNDLFEGRYRVFGRPVALGDIKAPVFAVSTEKDHVSPWRSVYKIHLLEEMSITFVLTTGGHNAGIVSEPGHKGRRYRIAERKPADPYLDPETWYHNARLEEGSWWPAWLRWLDEHSSGLTAPPEIGARAKGYPPLADAPGRYVLER